MGIVTCVTIPMLVGILFIGLIDLILFVKDKITVKQKYKYIIKYNSTGTYFLKGLRDTFEAK